MKLLRCIACDVHVGFIEEKNGWALAVAFLVLSLAALFLVSTARGGVDGLTAFDFYLGILGGAEHYESTRSQLRHFPLSWLASCLLFLYLVLDYPVRDRSAFGVQVMVALGGRHLWWLAKCIWVLLSALTYAAIMVGLCCAASLLGGVPSVQPTPEALEVIGASQGKMPPAWSLLIAFALIALGSLALIQLFVSLVLTPAIAFALSSALLIAAVFAPNSLNPLAVLMGLRAAEANGVLSIALLVGCGALAVAAGGLYLDRGDLLEGRGERYA